jgi:hypothetical protein
VVHRRLATVGSVDTRRSVTRVATQDLEPTRRERGTQGVIPFTLYRAWAKFVGAAYPDTSRINTAAGKLKN